jgi:cbb3-type cytochrome oxidase cytochrome c subunit
VKPGVKDASSNLNVVSCHGIPETTVDMTAMVEDIQAYTSSTDDSAEAKQNAAHPKTIKEIIALLNGLFPIDKSVIDGTVPRNPRLCSF